MATSDEILTAAGSESNGITENCSGRMIPIHVRAAEGECVGDIAGAPAVTAGDKIR